jgi:hypothetical protein
MVTMMTTCAPPRRQPDTSAQSSAPVTPADRRHPAPRRSAAPAANVGGGNTVLLRPVAHPGTGLGRPATATWETNHLQRRRPASRHTLGLDSSGSDSCSSANAGAFSRRLGAFARHFQRENTPSQLTIGGQDRRGSRWAVSQGSPSSRLGSRRRTARRCCRSSYQFDRP